MVNNIIYNKDSRHLIEIENNSIDYVITSPPFNIGHQYNYYVDSIDTNELIELYHTFICSVFRVLKSGGVFIIDIADVAIMNHDVVFTADLVKQICNNIGLYLAKTVPYIVMNSDHSQEVSFCRSSSICAHSNCEQIIYFTKGEKGNSHIKQYSFATEYDYSEVKDKAFWPHKLVNDILNSISIQHNTTILDPFMGSGQLGKIAIQMGAKFIGYDIDEEILMRNGWRYNK